jgi:colanic acid biosynthesis protein WcaH
VADIYVGYESLPFGRSGFVSNEEWAACVCKMPLVSIDLIVTNEKGQVLLGMRKNRPAKGMWFVPGGVLRKNETLDEAFSRVVLNELNAEFNTDIADLRRASFSGVYEHHYPDNFSGEDFGTHYVVMAHRFGLRVLSAREECLPYTQHAGYIWLSPQDILIHPDVHPLTKNYFLSS